VGSICGLTEGQTTVDWSQQDLGPFDCKIIAADFGFRRFSAVLTSLTVGQNAIGGPCSVSLINGAKTGVPVKKGVFAAVDGRWGQVNRDPDSDNEVQLAWLDDSTESSYTKVNKLDPVVSSRTDLVEDYSHIEQFGQAITRLTYLDVSACKFTPASIKTFTSSVTWETAALARVDIRGADVEEAVLETLRVAAPEGCDVVWEASGLLA
jgi:hypothetical protein